MFRALIVEDNPAFRESLHEVLSRRFPFMHICEAADGETALQEAISRRPDLVFMDIRLPGLNGLDVTRAIKSIRVNATICVITSHDLPEYRDAALRSGADHFLTKGESAESEIVAVVDSILSARVRTLIIEDNTSFREALDGILTGRWPSMVVAEAEDGPEGLENVAALKPDVVLLDLRLPTANGLDLARVIGTGRPEPVIVIMTAYDLPEYREAASRAGVPYFLAKSATVGDEIVGIVSAILAGRTAH